MSDDGLDWLEGVIGFVAGPIAGGIAAFVFQVETCTVGGMTDGGLPFAGICYTAPNANAGYITAVFGWVMAGCLITYREYHRPHRVRARQQQPRQPMP